MSGDTIQVVARFRPLSQYEVENSGQRRCVRYFPEKLDQVDITEFQEEERTHRFSLARMYSEETTQEELYQDIGSQTIKDVLQGYNGCIMAYGQTSSGKTYTIMGPGIGPPMHISSPQLSHADPYSALGRRQSTVPGDLLAGQMCDLEGPNRGIIPRAVDDLFQQIALSPASCIFNVTLSFVEVYKEKLRDLLDPSRTETLKLREDTANKCFYVEGCALINVDSPKTVLSCIEAGAGHRATASTRVNDVSSRSHSIVCLTVTTHDADAGIQHTGKLFLVDLAGSEKVAKTQASGERLDEAKKINQSLTNLSRVISSLIDKNAMHIPYRDSVLTKLLQNSLGGNSKTTLVVCCSPSACNSAETVSSLRFGSGASNVKNHAIINKEETPEQLRLMLARAEEEIRLLRAGIASVSGDSVVLSPPSRHSVAANEEAHSLRREIADLERKLQAAEIHVEDAAASLDEVLASKEDALDTVAALREEIIVWEREYTSLHKQHQQAVNQISSERSSNLVLKSAVHQVHEAMQFLQAEMSELRKRTTACSHQLISNDASPRAMLLPGVVTGISPETTPGKRIHEGEVSDLSPTASAYLRRALHAEQSLSTLEKNFQELIYDNGAWKLELQHAEKCLAIRNERVDNLKQGLRLEKQNLKDLQEKSQKQLQQLSGELRQARSDADFWKNECNRYKEMSRGLRQQLQVQREGSYHSPLLTPGSSGLAARFLKYVRGGGPVSTKTPATGQIRPFLTERETSTTPFARNVTRQLESDLLSADGQSPTPKQP